MRFRVALSLSSLALSAIVAASTGNAHKVHLKTSIPTGSMNEIRAGLLLIKVKGAQPPDAGPSPLFKTLTLRSQPTQQQIDDISEQVPGASFIKGLPHGGWTLWSIPMAMSPEAAAESARTLSEVSYAQPVHRVYPMLAIPNDADWDHTETDTSIEAGMPFLRLWHLRDMSAGDDSSGSMTGGWTEFPNQYYKSGDGHHQPLIAIVDTGCDMSHPDFINAGGTSTNSAHGGQLNVALSQQFLDGEQVTGGVTNDTNGHGTHVTGDAVAAANNQTVDGYPDGTIGVGYNSQAMILRVFDDADYSDDMTAAAAIFYAADNGADIISLSLGDSYYSQIFQDAVTYAWQKGSLVVAAGSENGASATGSGAGVGAGNLGPSYPAACSGALGISANGPSELIASYSGSGYYVGLAAPGGDFIYNLDFGSGGSGNSGNSGSSGVGATFAIQFVYSTATEQACSLSQAGLTPPYTLDYTYLAGTSMATPMVSGAAGLYYGYNGLAQAQGYANIKAYEALERSADPSNAVEYGGWEPVQGYGSLDVNSLLNNGVPNPRGATVGSAIGIVYYGGTPVANVRVTATPVNSVHTPYQTTSKPDGTYRFDRLPAGTYNISAAPFAARKTKMVAVTNGSDITGVDFWCGPWSGDTTPPTIAIFSFLDATTYGLDFNQWGYDTETGIDSINVQVGTAPNTANILPVTAVIPGTTRVHITTPALPTQYYTTFTYTDGDGLVSIANLAYELPTDDSFAHDGSGAGSTNVGNYLDVQSGPTGSNQVTYLKFNLAGTGTTISSATLTLTGSDTSATSSTAVKVGAYAIKNASWTQGALTWNNRPTVTGSAVDTKSVYGASATYTWNIQSIVAAAKAAHQTNVTIALVATNQTATDAVFNSTGFGGTTVPRITIVSHG